MLLKIVTFPIGKQNVYCRENAMLVDITTIVLGAFLFSLGGALFAYMHRFMVHYYAFKGMSKSNRIKTIKKQVFLKKVLMTYAIKSNSTKYYSHIGTCWCLICYYVYCICFIVFMSAFFVSIFSEISGMWTESARIAGISIFLSLISVVLPFKKTK